MVSSSVDDYEWIMDSRCSFHMTPNCLWFQEFTELEEGSKLLGFIYMMELKDCFRNLGLYLA